MPKPSPDEELNRLREAARGCTACPLWANATQTVFGEGQVHARIMFVGEQPGDQEDLHGRPFVGPAGKLLERALAAVGIDREQVYVTNAVKHFKWELRGKRRLHKTPAQREIEACRQWLEGEIRTVAPRIIVCLGATAAAALLGHGFRVTLSRGRPIKSDWAPYIVATVHPSSILRLRDDTQRHAAFDAFVEDLKVIRSLE